MNMCELCGDFVNKTYYCDVCGIEMCFNCKWAICVGGTYMTVCDDCKCEVEDE